jgi:O-antigen/teichoic acid export membrane protein
MTRTDATGRNEARDAGVLVFGRVIQTIAEAAAPFVIVRLLDKADVGALTALMAIYTVLAMTLTAGFPHAVQYFMAGRDAAQRAAIVRRLYTAVMVCGVAIGGVLWLIGVFGDQALATFGKWSSGDSAPADLHALRYMALFPVFDVLARVFPNYLIAIGRTGRAATFQVLRAIGLVAGQLIPAGLGWGLPGMVIGLTVFSGVQAIGIARVLRDEHRGVARVEPDVSVREMVKFAVPAGVTDMIGILNQQVDRFIMMAFPAAALADYGRGAWQIPVASIPYSVGQVYMERFTVLLEQRKGEEVMRLWRESIHKVSLIVVPVCMVFAVGAEEFVVVGFTAEYLDAAPVFRIYTIYTMARVASFGTPILAAGRSELLMRAAAFTLLSNLVISIPLALTIGFLGPAIGTLLAFIPTIAVYCLYIARALEVDVRNTFPVMQWLTVVALSTAAAVPAIALKLWVPMHPAFALVVYAVTITPLFVLLARLTKVMTAEDLAFAARWLRLDFLFDRKS